MSMDSGMKLGLLMETAQSHQKLAEAAIEKLTEHTQGLEAAMRDQVRCVLYEELTAVRGEIQGAIKSLQALKQAANARTTLWTLSVAAVASSHGGSCRSRRRWRPVMGTMPTTWSSGDIENGRWFMIDAHSDSSCAATIRPSWNARCL